MCSGTVSPRRRRSATAQQEEKRGDAIHEEQSSECAEGDAISAPSAENQHLQSIMRPKS